jgi:hypothetical protein
MNLQEQIPALRDTAVLLLPGFRHARAQLDVAVQVLEYFERHAEYEASTGKYAAFPLCDPRLLKEIERPKGMLNAFGRIHDIQT